MLRSNIRNDTDEATGINSGLDPSEGVHAQHHNSLAISAEVVKESAPNPLHHDAAGNGVDDDSAEVLECLADHTRMEFPEGFAFRVPAGLDIPSNKTIAGRGKLLVDGDADVQALRFADTVDGETDITLEDFELEGPASGALALSAWTAGDPTSRGIYFFSDNPGARIYARRLRIKNFALQGAQINGVERGCMDDFVVEHITHGNGMSLDAGAKDFSIGRPQVYDVADCMIGLHHLVVGVVISAMKGRHSVFGRALDIYGAQDVTVIGADCAEVGGHGVLAYPSDPVEISPLFQSSPKNINLIGFNVNGCGGDGVQAIGNQATLDPITDFNVIGGNIVDAGGVGVRLARKVLRANVSPHIYSAASDGLLVEPVSADVPNEISVDGLHAIGNGGWGIQALTGVTGMTGFAKLAGNTSGAILVPFGQSILYSSIDGLIQTTNADLVARIMYLDHGLNLATAIAEADALPNTIFKSSADGKAKFKDNGGTINALY